MKRSEALRLRRIIETSAQSLDDNTALQAACLYPVWQAGVDYAMDYKIQQDGKLWRCIQPHTSQTGWEPENTPALWEQINETHSGTLDDPIPYSGNMALVSGLHYVQDDVIYRCTTDTVNPVSHALRELVDLYVEEVAL